MSSEVVIRTSGLSKVYRLYDNAEDRFIEMVTRRRSIGRDFWALKDLDLEIRRGETIGIVGTNGSGKSTLLQLVCGITQPTTGSLEVYGRVAAMLQLGAGFNPEFTGRENVHMSAAVYGLTEHQIKERFPAIEAFAEIGPFIDQPVRHYSSGMYARLAFAICAHVDADILVVDEILGVGDAGFQQRCMRFFNSFRKRGTLLFVSHDTDAVRGLCSRAIWINRGILRATGNAKDVCRRYVAFISRGNLDHDNEYIEQKNETAAIPARSKPFDFDLDTGLLPSSSSMIESAKLFTVAGRETSAAPAGDEVELRVTIRPTRPIAQPVIGFALRDRLGQIIFGMTTADGNCPSPGHSEPGRPLEARFRFRMPILRSGGYAIEPAIFEKQTGKIIEKQLDILLVHVTADPRMNGLANIPMRRIRFMIGERIVGDGAPDDAGAFSQSAPPPQPRYPIEVMTFRPDAPGHGTGGAQIIDAQFFDVSGTAITKAAIGDDIELRFTARANAALTSPILGFMLLNELGQVVFGESTFPVSDEAKRNTLEGEMLTASFFFRMPAIAAGNFTLTLSVKDGTPRDHSELHTMEDALALRVLESPAQHGIVAVPAIDMSLSTIADAKEATA
jgi:lipopolysaccharide transport system ATP-binding protein